MQNATLLFLIKREQGQIVELCLAMKKRGLGIGKWNGVGGKQEQNDKNIDQTAKRETQEEINVSAQIITKVAELQFEFINKPEWNQFVHVYFCEKWQGEPEESEEMLPCWFEIADIPYQEMWTDDIYWLPMILRGDQIKANFRFADDSEIQNYTIAGTINISDNF